MLNSPTGNYQINYKAILAWIRANCVQQNGRRRPALPAHAPFSNTLFYSSIPTDVPASAYTWTNANSSITSSPDPSLRFWKEYIDFVLGVWHDPFGNIQIPGTSTCSYGPDFTAGPLERHGVSISGPDSTVYINGLVQLHPSLPAPAPVTLRRRPTVTFSASAGTTGTATAATATDFTDGQVTAVTVTNAGSGYTSTPTITFSGGGLPPKPPPPPPCKRSPS